MLVTFSIGRNSVCTSRYCVLCHEVMWERKNFRIPVTHEIILHHWHDKVYRYVECELAEQKITADTA